MNILTKPSAQMLRGTPRSPGTDSCALLELLFNPDIEYLEWSRFAIPRASAENRDPFHAFLLYNPQTFPWPTGNYIPASKTRQRRSENSEKASGTEDEPVRGGWQHSSGPGPERE